MWEMRRSVAADTVAPPYLASMLCTSGASNVSVVPSIPTRTRSNAKSYVEGDHCVHARPGSGGVQSRMASMPIDEIQAAVPGRRTTTRPPTHIPSVELTLSVNEPTGTYASVTTVLAPLSAKSSSPAT